MPCKDTLTIVNNSCEIYGNLSGELPRRKKRDFLLCPKKDFLKNLTTHPLEEKRLLIVDRENSS